MKNPRTRSFHQEEVRPEAARGAQAPCWRDHPLGRAGWPSGGMLPIIYFGVYQLYYNFLLLMLVTLGPSAMISDLNPFFFLSCWSS